VEQKLKQALSQRQKVVNRDASLKPSAVLVPLFVKDGEYHLAFTRRTHRVRVHKGEISFPGGAREKGDKTLLDTALRECSEEIGLAADDVEILGELDDCPTIHSDYIISPFVGYVPQKYPFKLDQWEVAELITLPVSTLMDNDVASAEPVTIQGRTVNTYAYRFGSDLIWGASARILHQFLEVWTGLKP